MAADLTSYTALVKRFYPQSKITDLSVQGNPFLGQVARATKWHGSPLRVALQYEATQRRSRTFATAQSHTGTNLYKGFDVEPVKDYALATVDRMSMKIASGPGAIEDLIKREVDGALNSVTKNLARSMFRSNSGSIGRISLVASDVLTLSNAGDVFNFAEGQKICLSDVDGTGSLRNSGATATVESVDYDAGTVTLTAALTSTIGAGVANDYIFTEGDHAIGMSGLANWISATAPSASDSFWGVNRSANAAKLAGNRYDATLLGSVPMEQLLHAGAMKSAKLGGSPDACYLSFSNYEKLLNSLQSQVRYVDAKSKVADVFFQAAQINGPMGPMKVFPDINCPDNRGYVLSMNSWLLRTVGEAVHIVEDDISGGSLRDASADAFSTRIASYGNLVCDAPGHNTVILF